MLRVCYWREVLACNGVTMSHWVPCDHAIRGFAYSLPALYTKPNG